MLFSSESVAAKNEEMENFLKFTLENESYFIEERQVVKICDMLSISPVLGTPDYFKGIAKLGDKIIPIIDVPQKLRKKHAAYNNATQIVIIDIEGTRCGLIVDEVETDDNICANQVHLYISDMEENQYYFKGFADFKNDQVKILDCKNLLIEDNILDLAQLIS
jgi:purine-binding chemotaxis protein CheW